MNLVRDILNMVYPQYCFGCHTLLQHGDVLCLHCLQQLPFTHFFREKENPVKEIFYGRLKTENAASLIFYAKNSLAQRLILDLKYRGNRQAGIFLAHLLAEEIGQTSWIKDIDIIAPMPMHKKKEQARGYNQAAIIADNLAKKINIPTDKHSVIKSSQTETQTHKTREDRWQSMQNVFSINNKNPLRGKHILLVDDVLTTGATLEVCGNEILKIPDTKLSIVTAAYAI